jgi:hypothetical protein
LVNWPGGREERAQSSPPPEWLLEPEPPEEDPEPEPPSVDPEWSSPPPDEPEVPLEEPVFPPWSSTEPLGPTCGVGDAETHEGSSRCSGSEHRSPWSSVGEGWADFADAGEEVFVVGRPGMFAFASMREEMANTVAASTNGSRSPAAAINQNLVLLMLAP